MPTRSMWAAELPRLNPWWREPGWTQHDYDLRAAAAAPFAFTSVALDDIHPPNLYTLRGPRRAGKSTLLKQTIVRLIQEAIDPRLITYASVDAVREYDDLIRLVQGALTLFPDLSGRSRYIFLDEVTAVSGWQRAIKWLRDSSPAAEACIVVTGSSSGDIDAGSTFLAGRRGPGILLDRVLLPMSFTDFTRYSGMSHLEAPPALPLNELFTPAGRRVLESSLVHAGDLIDAFDLYLTVGGFPRAVADFRAQARVSAAFVRDLWEVTRSDLIRSGIQRPEVAMKLLERLSAAMTAPVTLQSLARDLDSTRQTVQTWLTDLANAYLIIFLFQETGGIADLRRQRKIYPADPLLALLPSLISSDVSRPDLSKLAESALVMTLIRSVTRSPVDQFDRIQGVFFYRSPKGAEIDLVIPGHHAAIESKFTDAHFGRTRLGLSRYESAAIITHTSINLEEPIPELPAGLFAWLLRQS